MTPESPNSAQQLHLRAVPKDVEAANQLRALKKLSRLHDEAIETAELANLLGRTPFVAWLFIAGMAVVALTSAGVVPLARLIVWCLFGFAAVIPILRLHNRTIVAPFELLPLRAFEADLEAALLYAGSAWGAGAFLALPGVATPLMVLLFSAGTAAGVGAILRARLCFYFIVPAIVLPVLAAILRPLPDAPLASLLVLLGGTVVAGLLWMSGHLIARRQGLGPLPLVTFS